MSSRSRKGAWIEILPTLAAVNILDVAPVRERGLKFFPERLFTDSLHVAPVRERGLKSPVLDTLYPVIDCRSRKGAWIEIWLLSFRMSC